MITNENQIKDSADILSIVSRRVPIKQRGAQYKGLCPFHQEKTPSFTVTPAKKMFHCFGCNIGGDAIKFVMNYENKTYPEALEIVAAESSVIVEYDKSAVPEPGIPRQNLYEACAIATSIYALELQDPKNKKAIDYLYSRGFTDPLIEKFQLGYSRGYCLAERVGNKEAMLEAGILGKPDPDSKNQDLYDPLAGRVIIPLLDSLGRIVGFTGRKLPGGSDETAKYKNTRETKIFQKGQILYGYKFAQEMLRTARKEVKRDLYILEGQLKAAAALVAGFAGVAPGGTAFTARQAALVDYLNPETVYIVPDPDPAGIHSAIKTACELRNLELNVKIASLVIPDQCELQGKIDTDDLMAAGLPVQFEHTDLVEWLLVTLCSKPFNSPDSVHKITESILPVIFAHPNPLIRDAEINLLSNLSGTSSITLAKYKPGPAPAAATSSAQTAQIITSLTPGCYLCAALLQQPIDNLISKNTGDLWYQMWIDWTQIPLPLLKWLRRIAMVHKHAAYYKIPVVSAIEKCCPADSPQLNYWLALPEIEVASLDLINKLQLEAIKYSKENKEKPS
ncbi:MAG TPA: DNA primase [Lentisphaeria bacterium]|nr:MAG: DNA primase [Lentisphaerae bacterium GWF2_49_21]HBC89555.1 DNA primase [Lentisphaeria bacterium]